MAVKGAACFGEAPQWHSNSEVNVLFACYTLDGGTTDLHNRGIGNDILDEAQYALALISKSSAI